MCQKACIGIPDFPYGGQENWGAVTYRETRLIIQEGVASAEDKEASSMTIAHEEAHMVRV